MAIKTRKHIIYDTIRPIDKLIQEYTKMLSENNYKIFVIFHMANINILKQRILTRGEILYSTHKYYRAFNMKQLPSIINDLVENLNNYIIPAKNLGIITDIFYVTS